MRLNSRLALGMLLAFLLAGVLGQSPKEEMLRNFRNPPDEFAPIDTWWWEGGRLSQQKLKWQLEELKDKGVAGTWFYPRFPNGAPLGSDPPYWSDRWWDFTRFSMQEHQRLGMKAWFSDWTAHQFFQNRLREESKKDASLVGRRLISHQAEPAANGVVTLDVPDEEEVLDIAAYQKVSNGLDYASRRDLKANLQGRRLTWSSPGAGWTVIAIASQPHDLNYLDRTIADRLIQIYLGEYQQRLPEFIGKVLAAYGPDEMYLLMGNVLFSPSVLKRIRDERAYDPAPYLAALFYDVGAKTEKVRCDYYDAMAAVLEENFYKPISQWLQQRGMQYVTIATWGRENLGEQTLHYGDFIRYMRWFHVTGNEDPEVAAVGERKFIDSKLSSSIAHLFGRKRAAVCAYWGAGWGMSLEQNLAWTNENYAYGINFYNQHGALNTLNGGWYEWVPPAVDFYQPYWQYWKHFTDYIRRLSYVMSQGTHRADVALLYPQTTLHAGRIGGQSPAALKTAVSFTADAQEASQATIKLMKAIYRSGLDFDVIDHRSLEKAQINSGRLSISGLEFRALVIPPMTTIRTETLAKIKEFRNAGGAVVFFGRLPDISAENGRDDAALREAVRAMSLVQGDENGVPRAITSAIVPDVTASDKDVFHTHQRAGSLDIYFLFNARPQSRNLSLRIRAQGSPEIWDPFTGEVRPVDQFRRESEVTEVTLDMEPYQGTVLVFDRGSSRPPIRDQIAESSADPLTLDGSFSFRLEPTMDNRWGDFRYPPSPEFIGAEARQFKYMEEAQPQPNWQKPDFDDSAWPSVTWSFGPFWSQLGPLAAGDDAGRRVEQAASGPAKAGDWQPYVFSWKFGSPTHRIHSDFRQGSLLGVSENFFVFDEPKNGKPAVYYLYTNVHSPEAKTVTLRFGGPPEKEDYDKARHPIVFDVPSQRKAWVNGMEALSIPERRTDEVRVAVPLEKGWNTVLLKVVTPSGKPSATYALFEDGEPAPHDAYIPLLRWFSKAGQFVYDVTPEKQNRVGWYRFKAPPGLHRMKLGIKARAVEAWIDGEPFPVRNGEVELKSPKKAVSQVALRVQQDPGYYAGAAFPDPIKFECAEGEMPLGDWSEHGLSTYSGAAVYSKQVNLSAEQLKGKVLLDLGRAATVAEVHVNGKPAGVRFARPFRFDVTKLVRAGGNEIQIKVANTLANHMSTYPTKFVFEGQTVSGLLGPVRIEFK